MTYGIRGKSRGRTIFHPMYLPFSDVSLESPAPLPYLLVAVAIMAMIDLETPTANG